ncbi:F-box only protein 9 [Orchesella cincta]|uniref:F-box only protein 9 n=1 Tax=Orchesella cincta TaxID=48709 RepID=A0A1D2MW59_ORCCI|nr:F-box only protein 9 [Orchesella cincta]
MDSTAGAPKGASKTGKTGGDSTLDAGEDSESESESSSSSSSKVPHTRNIAKELDSFRLQWKAELKKGPSSGTSNKNKNTVGSKSLQQETSAPSSQESESLAFVTGGGSVGNASVEDQAKHWFLKGVGLERSGELYDAVRCYRRAIQLVPDIEYRIGTGNVPNANASENSSSVGTPHESDDETDNEAENDCEDDDGPLNVKFLKIIEANGWNFFQKSKDDNRTHINELPVEVLSYILRWVISCDLDVRSLDILSNASRGFYCLCRDEKLWQMACDKIWSDVTESNDAFSSFREMFLKRPRVRFDGPWHFVEYYRYIRFLPNGEILFLTTSDEPAISVSGLRDSKYPRNSTTMRGHYQLFGDNVVSAVVKKPSAQPQTPVYRGRNTKVQTQEVTTFHMEFEITPVKARSNWMLKWLRYAVYISRCSVSSGKGIIQNQLNNNPTVASSTFDLNPNKFPPLYFSRVKSYTQKSEGIL